MIIKPTQKFRHGRETFEPGHEYEVVDSAGYLFVANGWAEADGIEGGDPSTDPVTLSVDGAQVGHTAGEVS